MNDKITLAHGAGGKQTSELIGGLFKKYFDNPNLTADDAAVLEAPKGKMAMTTDGFIVSPAFFPGGNIGKLSICGTVNDLACMGAKPLYISCACVIEEGFPMDTLEKIVKSMAETAAKVGVQIVSGDTKVAGKGQVDYHYRCGRNHAEGRTVRCVCPSGRCHPRYRRCGKTRMHDSAGAGPLRNGSRGDQ